VVVRDASSTETLSQDRYDFMRGAQQLGQPIRSLTVPINQGPILPALPDSKRESIVPAPLQPAQTFPVQPAPPAR
jgi:general secretion pathway protein D